MSTDKWKRPKPTEKQVDAVNNLISGKFKTKKAALEAAGYSALTASNASDRVLSGRGVEVYIQTLSKIAKHRFGLSLGDKVALTYLDGLEATKRVGKDADVEMPDWMARKSFADALAQFLGWAKPQLASPQFQGNQFNFFSVSAEERRKFNSKFREFLDERLFGEAR